MTQTILTPQGRRLALSETPGQGAPVIFLGGLASDMTGTKALFLQDWAQTRGRPVTRFDYSGHGASSGAFTDGTVSQWAEDAAAILARVNRPAVLVGSSLGGWIALLLARAQPDRVAALVTIAAAPDFTERLMWDGWDDATRTRLMTEGHIDLPSDYGAPLTVTRALIADGRASSVLDRPLLLPMPVRMLQGTADADVPAAHALRLFDHATGPDIRLTLVKDADHRFSSPACLALIAETLDNLPQS